MDRFLTGAGDTVASAGTVDDKETILRLYFFLVPLLDAVLCSIKCRFSKHATEFMTRITAFSPENWVNEADEKKQNIHRICALTCGILQP